MDILRLFNILLFFSAIGLLYIYLGLRIIIRKNDKYSQYISAFYFTQSLIFIINLVIVFIFVEYTVYILYLILLFIGSIGFGFLLIFIGMLFYPNNNNNINYFRERKTRVYYILLYAIALLGIFFIPESVSINKSTDWRPVYSFHFMLYLIIVNIGMAGVPLIVMSIRMYYTMESLNLKRKFLCFCIALYLYFFVLISLTILNYLNLDSRLLNFGISLIMLPSAFLMYYGMNKL